MPTFMLAAELLLEVKDLLQANTVGDVRDQLDHAGFQTSFDTQILPLVSEDCSQEIPELSEIQDVVVTALQGGSATEAYSTIAQGMGSANLVQHATALILDIADCIGTGDHGGATYAGWMITKLMLAMMRYQNLYPSGSWDDFQGLDAQDSADEEEESSDEDYEMGTDQGEHGYEDHESELDGEINDIDSAYYSGHDPHCFKIWEDPEDE